MSGWEYDVAIVGAGIVGAACADELSRRGLRVMVLDSDSPGSGATMAAMGHIVVMDNSEAQFALTRYSQQLWQSLRPELPDDVEYETRGTIWVAGDEEEMREAARKHAYYESRGVPTRVLNSQELRSEEPGLRSDLAGGLLVPEDIVVNPPYAARFLVDRAMKNGATIQTGCAVGHVGDRSLRLTGGRRISAKFIVNAAGVNAPDLTPGIDITKRKGHLAITDQESGFLRHQLVELAYLKSAHSVQNDSVAFNVQPRRNGQILVGSSRQYGSQTANVDDEILEQMLSRAKQYLPGLAEMSISRVWTGFRAATLDNLPLIGVWPQDESVFLATGHEGLGITTSLATAQLLADQITGTASQISITPYWPSRELMAAKVLKQADSTETGVVT
jgi:D-hydroxyproline dehydrogenase subunit beta